MGNLAEIWDDWMEKNHNPDVFIEPSDLEINVLDICDELSSLLIQKHKDYGPLNISNSPGGAINGLRVRMHDKLARINNIYENSKDFATENESFEDSFKDLANYAIIGMLVLRGKWDTDENIRTVQGK